MSETDDTAPLQAVSLGASFDEFYRREFSRIAVVAGTVVGDRSVGEDIAQEALAKAHGEWSHVSTLDKPGAWVRRVAINLGIGRKRRLVSETRALFKLGQPAEAAAETRRGDPAIWAAVDELAPRQRAVVALRYLDDLSVAEIADVLEISVSAATSNLHKARTRLADLLGESHG